MSEEEAYQAFKLVRWAATDGDPVCPRCGCVGVYTYATRKLFKCKGCSHQFSVTSGTIFASRKLSIRDYLLAIAIFVNGAKGHSALQLSRDLDELRGASGPLRTREIAQAIVAVGGQDARDRKLITDVTRRASKALRILKEGGDVRSAVDRNGNLNWALRS